MFIYTYIQVCVLEDICIRLFLHHNYRSHYIHIACMFGKCIMGYEYFLQHRHVFRRFHMKCIARNTLNAYSLHVHMYERCGVCARLTWLFAEVSTHLYSTDTLTRAHTH
jgi:hypothetical protein